jgi:hypothetical protein
MDMLHLKSNKLCIQYKQNLLLPWQDIPNCAFGHKHTYGRDGSLIGKHLPRPHRSLEQGELIFSIPKKRQYYFYLKLSIPVQSLPVHVGKQLQIKLVKPSTHAPLIHGFEEHASRVAK